VWFSIYNRNADYAQHGRIIVGGADSFGVQELFRRGIDHAFIKWKESALARL
jgi:hypothetical protein